VHTHFRRRPIRSSDPMRPEPASISTDALAAWAPLPTFDIISRHYDRAEIQQHDPQCPIRCTPLRCFLRLFSPLSRFPHPEGLSPLSLGLNCPAITSPPHRPACTRPVLTGCILPLFRSALVRRGCLTPTSCALGPSPPFYWSRGLDIDHCCCFAASCARSHTRVFECPPRCRFAPRGLCTGSGFLRAVPCWPDRAAARSVL
jgi:hypothetical protein